MTRTWHQIANDLVRFARLQGFDTKTDRCGELNGHVFYNSYMLCTDNEHEALYDAITTNEDGNRMDEASLDYFNRYIAGDR